MLACHVDLVIVSYKSHQDRTHSAFSDVHHIGNLIVRVDGTSVEIIQTAIPMPENCPQLFFSK